METIVIGDSDYKQFRGKCKEMSEELIQKDPTLTLVRGWYHCPVWGPQQHWWCKREDGTIVDPTCRQFPSKGNGDYEEFDGTIDCEYCGTNVKEEEAYIVGHHAYCSYKCYGHDIGF